MFYTYLWLREDGTPYYVGKGKGNRAWRSGSPNPDRVIIQKFPKEEDAYFSEKFLIRFFGRIDIGTGCLRNLTSGGEGNDFWRNKNRSESTKEKCRSGSLGNKNAAVKRSRESIENIRKAHIGLRLTKEHKKNIGESLSRLPKREGTSSAYKGVVYRKSSGRWIAYSSVKGKTKYLGSFSLEEQAAMVRRKFQEEIYGKRIEGPLSCQPL